MSASQSRPFAPARKRLLLRMTAEDREQLELFAQKADLPLGRAAIHLMRRALQPRPGTPAEPRTQSARESQPLTEELAIHNLIATEQVIKLLERIVRHGPGAADEVLVEAGQAAQQRLAAGEDAVVATTAHRIAGIREPQRF